MFFIRIRNNFLSVNYKNLQRNHNIFIKNFEYMFTKFQRHQLHTFNKKVYPWMNHWKPHWIRPQNVNQNLLDSDLTSENAELLKNYREIEYRLDSPLLHEFNSRKPYINGRTQRCGLIGIKLGIYPVFSAKGEKVDCTLVQILDNHVIRWIPPADVKNYYAESFTGRSYMPHKSWVPRWIRQERFGIQLVGAVSADPRNFSPAYCGLFSEAGVPPKRKIARFLVTEDAAMQPGTFLSIHHFRLGDYVDVTARSINRGFQGVIERHSMSGGPKAHGATKFHRKMGSAAGCGGPIIRGKRMPGVMGNVFKTRPAVQILRINYRYNILYLHGPTPGPTHSYCQLHDPWVAPARRSFDANPPLMPTALPDDYEDLDLPEEVFHSSIRRFDQPSLHYPPDPVEKSKKR